MNRSRTVGRRFVSLMNTARSNKVLDDVLVLTSKPGRGPSRSWVQLGLYNVSALLSRDLPPNVIRLDQAQGGYGPGIIGDR